MIEEEIKKFEKEILSVKMKKYIEESKIIEEKEEWSLIMNEDHNKEMNKKYLDKNMNDSKEKFGNSSR